MLYWCDIRLGEPLTLTSTVFHFKGSILNIDKSYQRLNKQDVITPPKTKKSVRKIVMPSFLSEEMKEYIKEIYDLGPTTASFRRARATYTTR